MAQGFEGGTRDEVEVDKGGCEADVAVKAGVSVCVEIVLIGVRTEDAVAAED